MTNFDVNLMDVNDVASALKVSAQTIRRWAGQKRLLSMKLGARTLFHPRDVADFVEKMRAGRK
jgi:excisionase family DNA binding protein